jgi:hypothetical protein
MSPSPVGNSTRLMGPLRNTLRRSHRWEKLERDDDTLIVAREDPVHKVLFSVHPDDVGLYCKPMARNAQVWSDSFEPLLHGPTADGAELHRALERMKTGGSFGYRLYYPPMLVGTHEVFWHRPLVAFRDLAGITHVMTDGVPNGYLEATDRTSPAGEAVELWPRMEALEAPNATTAAKGPPQAEALEKAELNLRKLDDARVMLGVPIREGFARALLTTGKMHSFSEWQSLAAKIVKGCPALAAAFDQPRQRSRQRGRALAGALVDLRLDRLPVLRGGLLEDDRNAVRGTLPHQE